MKYLCAILVLLCVEDVFTHSNNVCKTFPDYYIDLPNNPNCFYNPDIDLSVPEIVQRHGYPAQNYSVTTEDGYILTVFRIPHGRGFANQARGPPIFIQHGLGANSLQFVDIGNKSLAFVLADQGYDVWLGNFRGSKYSNKHLYLSYNSKQYWDFTFHEIGIYDLPAVLDLVVKKTQQKVFYIGHSMGTSAYYVYNAEYPSQAKKTLRLSISMAPIAFVGDITSIYKVLTIPIITNIAIGIGDIVTDGAINQQSSFSRTLTKLLCLPYPIQMDLCAFPSNFFLGFDYPQNDPTTLPVTTVQGFDAMGLKTLEHYAQLVHSGRFQQYDYGRYRNREMYGSANPPQYNLSKINIPNYFIRANSDPLATKKNVEKTYSALPASAKPFGGIYLVPYKGFDHQDFVQAKDVKELLYNHIVDFLIVNGPKFQ